MAGSTRAVPLPDHAERSSATTTWPSSTPTRARDGWLRANFVSSLDGAAQGPDHKSGSLSSQADQKVFAHAALACAT